MENGKQQEDTNPETEGGNASPEGHEQGEQSPQGEPSQEEAATGGDEGTNEEVERLSAELNELKDKYMRTAAEMENMRRRMEKERSDLMKFGLEGFFKDLLPILDSLENAIPEEKPPESQGQDASSYYEGMVMVKKQLLDTLKKHGLEPVPSEGQPFDPNVHQAVQKVESNEVEQDTVHEEFARGYTLNGRLLRPAMVSVATPS